LKSKIILTAILLYVCNLTAQDSHKITGSVLDATQSPIPYANVFVTNESNDVVEGTITNEEGGFVLEVNEGNYAITISYLGFKDWRENVTITKALQIDTIILEEDLNQLDEVIVVAKQKLITRNGDKIIMNVANNAFTKGKSTTEILKYAPFVRVDPSSNGISIKGLAVNILINGKRTNLNNENLMSYLDGLGENELKSIEIISNPSARYDAEGLGGTINIITNTPKKKGLNGGINSLAIFSKFFSYSNSVQINSRVTDKFSISAFLLNQDTKNLSEEDRVETLLSPRTIYNYAKIDTTESSDLFANIDLSYDITPNDEVVLQFRVLDNNSERAQSNDLTITDDLVTPSTGIYGNDGDVNYYAVGLNYNKKLDTLGQRLTFITDFYDSDNQSLNRYENRFFDQDENLVDSNSRRSIGNSSFKIFSSQIDYTKPFDQNNRLELGGKYSSVQNESNSLFENRIGDEFLIDTNFTNEFDYDEQIIAGYASYGSRNVFKSKLNVQLGLRLEHTIGEGRIETNNFTLNKNYTNLFPSVFINKPLKDNKSIGVSYSRRINRPNYSRFNPTIFYITDFTSQVGNPDLNPAYTNSFEFNYNSSNLNVLLYYNDISGEAREILTRLSDNELRYQWRNIDENSTYGVSLSYNQKVNDWWTVFLSSSWYGKKYLSTFDDVVENIDVSKGTFQTRIATQFTLPYEISTEVSFEYNGSETYGQFESGENFAFYIDISKKISDKLSLYVKVIDPFDRLRYQFENSQQGIRTTQFRNNFSRALRLSLRYNFDLGGKTKNVRYKRSSKNLKNRSN
jgi:hypothetical protein